MGNQSNLKKFANSGRGFKGIVVVANDHNNHLLSGMATICLNDDYTNLNAILANEYPGECNIILVLDGITNRLAEIMPNKKGCIPWEEYRESKQWKHVCSKVIATAGKKLYPNDPISYSATLSLLAEFMPEESSTQVISLIRAGISNGMKWIILKDEQQNIRCCLHPDDIRHWNNQCA